MKILNEPTGNAGNVQEMAPGEAERQIDSIKKELADFSSGNKIPNLEDRVHRGLDPIGIIALKETDEKVRLLCEKTNTGYEAAKKMILDIQLGGPWDYAQKLKEGNNPAARAWIMLNAANNMGKDREMDLTGGEFLKDLERIKRNLDEANADPEAFFQKAKVHVLEESKKRFRVEDGVPISEMDNGFTAMAVNGYEAGIIQDADGLLFVGAKKINDAVFEQWKLKSEVRDDGRGHMATFYVNDKGESVIKKLYPGFAIVLSRNFDLAKAMVKGSNEVNPGTLGHKLYRPTSMKEKSKDPGRIKRSPRVKEEAVPENLPEPERKRAEFYSRLVFLKTQQTFRDKANAIIRKNKEKGLGRVTNDTLETEAGKTQKKLMQKMEELKYMISLMGDELDSLPPEVDRIVDMAGGAGDLGLAVSMEMMVRGRKLNQTEIVDPEEDLALYNKLLVQELPDSEEFKKVVRFEMKTLQEAEIPDNAVVVAKHACGDLTDTIIEKWVQSESPLLIIMTCCQEKAADRPARYNIPQDDWKKWCRESSKTNSPGNARKIAEGMDAMTKLDTARVSYLRRYGFEAKLVQTDKFPKGDVIIARRIKVKK